MDTASSLISTHAPTQGATFQAKGVKKYAEISTHAPTQGATAILYIYRYNFGHFNPRPHTGGDLMAKMELFFY